MTHRFPDDALVVAHQLSDILLEIADQLDRADDARTFVEALCANGRAWRDLAMLAPLSGCQVTAAMVGFVSSACAHAREGVDDHEVEAMIAINRRVADELARMHVQAVQPFSLWSEWMARQVDAITWRDGPPDKVASGSSAPSL